MSDKSVPMDHPELSNKVDEFLSKLQDAFKEQKPPEQACEEWLEVAVKAIIVGADSYEIKDVPRGQLFSTRPSEEQEAFRAGFMCGYSHHLEEVKNIFVKAYKYAFPEDSDFIEAREAELKRSFVVPGNPTVN